MLPLWALMAIGGAAKSKLIDEPKEQRERELAAKTALYSPWTGMKPEKVKEADPIGEAFGWGLTGHQLSVAEQNRKLLEKAANQAGSIPTQVVAQASDAQNPWNYDVLRGVSNRGSGPISY